MKYPRVGYCTEMRAASRALLPGIGPRPRAGPDSFRCSPRRLTWRLRAEVAERVATGVPTLEALAEVPEVEPSDADPFRFAEPVSDSEIPF